MAQTTYYSILESPSGHRLVQQCGKHAFVSTGGDVTLTVGFRRLLSAHIRPNETLKKITHIPYVSASQFTALTSRSIIVSRLSSAQTAMAFSYRLVGY